jgi:2'-5' RNA ligase
MNITENRKNEYGCLMALVAPRISKNIIKFGKTIVPDEILHIGNPEDNFGRDEEPHVTVKFGFTKDLTDEDIKKIISEASDISRYVIRAGGGSGTRELEDDEMRSSLLSMENKAQNKLSWKLIAEGLSVFEGDGYDVAKFDIKKDDLITKLHNICNTFPNIEKFPEFHPHLTIAYVKKGTFPHRATNRSIPLPITGFKYSGMDGSKRWYEV